MRRVRKDRVSVEKFVTAVVRHWNANSTLSAAAAELRMSAPNVSTRLKRLHKLGVKGLPAWGAPRKKRNRSIAARARAALAKTPAIGV
jgi:hypothetical protein